MREKRERKPKKVFNEDFISFAQPIKRKIKKQTSKVKQKSDGESPEDDHHDEDFVQSKKVYSRIKSKGRNKKSPQNSKVNLVSINDNDDEDKNNDDQNEPNTLSKLDTLAKLN